jgi:hypothetical protein
MKLVASPFVVRVWMPLLFVISMCLFLRGMAPEYWLLAVPVLLVAIFMSTLADVRDDDHRIVIRTIWKSLHISKKDIVKTTPSVLDGIGVLYLRQYVFPWGRVYFVADWSKLAATELQEESINSDSKLTFWAGALLVPLAMAISGFLVGVAIRLNIQSFRIEPATRMWAFTLAGLLCVVFALARTRKPSFANVVLFAATGIVGFIRW